MIIWIILSRAGKGKARDSCPDTGAGSGGGAMESHES
jgi:hypothetical protein